MQIFGRSGSELRDRIGSLAQLARIDSFVDDQGSARGARRLRLITGGGLEVDLHPDRALDLGAVTYWGIPLAWASPVGVAAPGLADATGADWLRTFGGGLLATCGLDTFGPPRAAANGGTTAFHGRIGATPAVLTRAEVTGDALVVEGTVRQAAVFGENLVLRRSIRCPLGGAAVELHDTVTNEGTAPATHLLLYHCNLGWPLVDPGAALTVPSARVDAVTAEAEAAISEWTAITEPRPEASERVYVHGFAASSHPQVTIDNPGLDVRLALSFDAGTLPALVQWKMLASQTYVLGLEPTNFAGARSVLRGELPAGAPRLAPGESVRYALRFDLGRSGGETTKEEGRMLGDSGGDHRARR